MVVDDSVSSIEFFCDGTYTWFLNALPWYDLNGGGNVSFSDNTLYFTGALNDLLGVPTVNYSIGDTDITFLDEDETSSTAVMTFPLTFPITFGGTTVTNDKEENARIINSMADNQEVVAVTGLDDSNLNDDYYITSFDFRQQGGEPCLYRYIIAMEKIRDRLG